MHLFEDANLCAIHAKRVTIMTKDIQVCILYCCDARVLPFSLLAPDVRLTHLLWQSSLTSQYVALLNFAPVGIEASADAAATCALTDSLHLTVFYGNRVQLARRIRGHQHGLG